MVGIMDYQGYVPAQSMSRAAMVDAIGWTKPALKGLGKGQRRFAQWDEDAITLSVAAARHLTPTEPIAEFPGKVCFASTTAPFLDRQNAGLIAAALDLPAETHCFDFTGSQRAATSALITLASVDENAMLVAADCRPTQAGSVAEISDGDGSAALTVGPGDGVAHIVATGTLRADLVDHYRTAASGTDYQLEERWFRDEGLLKLIPQAVAPVLKRAGISSDAIDHFILPAPNAAMSGRVARTLGIPASAVAQGLYVDCGHTGVAHPLLMLADTLDKAKPGQWILLCGIGQGCDVIVLKTTEALSERQNARAPLQDLLQRGRVEDNYTRFLVAQGKLDVDWGMRAERDNRTAQTVAYNKSRDIYGFVGGQCDVCATPQFPKSRRCVNPKCGALDSQSDYRFADLNAQVKSFTEDWMAFTRNPPLLYGNMNFDGGGNVFMEMTGFEPGTVSIGTPVRPAFRIKDIDAMRGFQRYFWKAGPVDGVAHG